MNHTHPTLCIPELIRILIDIKGLSWKDACNITQTIVAHTNHISRPEHIVLIKVGQLNQEVKIWVCDNEEDWLFPGDSESWHCIQTLGIRSSSETNPEDAFFNQVVALPRAGLFLLANAKKNTVYVVHIERGSSPTATRMDYIGSQSQCLYQVLQEPEIIYQMGSILCR